jgi:hypothetical protein
VDFVAVFNGLEAVAVEFEFVFPVGAFGELADEFREHGSDEGGWAGHGESKHQAGCDSSGMGKSVIMLD